MVTYHRSFESFAIRGHRQWYALTNFSHFFTKKNTTSFPGSEWHRVTSAAPLLPSRFSEETWHSQRLQVSCGSWAGSIHWATDGLGFSNGFNQALGFQSHIKTEVCSWEIHLKICVLMGISPIYDLWWIFKRAVELITGWYRGSNPTYTIEIRGFSHIKIQAIVC